SYGGPGAKKLEEPLARRPNVARAEHEDDVAGSDAFGERLCRPFGVAHVERARAIGERARAGAFVGRLARGRERLRDDPEVGSGESGGEVVEERAEPARRMRLEDHEESADRARANGLDGRADLGGRV